MLIVSSLNLFSSVMETFGSMHLISHSLVFWSFSFGEKRGETASFPLVFSILFPACKTLVSSCELNPPFLPSGISSSDEKQALAPTSSHLYLEWPVVPSA